MNATEECKYVDDVLRAVEELLYTGHINIRVERDLFAHIWKVHYEG